MRKEACRRSLQLRLNIDADPAGSSEAMEYGHWKADGCLTRTLIDAPAETVDWLCGLGRGIQPDHPPHGESVS